MGTITKYYPFIDEESKTTLNSLMNQSSNYYDFVQRLCALVLENEVPVNLVYIAAGQAWWCRTEETIELIQEKYKDISCIRPWRYTPANTDKDQLEYHDAIVEEITKASETPLDDWILTELHLLHSYFHYPFLGDVPSLLEPIEDARHLMEANSFLGCFEPLICALEGWAKHVEGEVEDALDIFQKGQGLAESSADSLYKYVILINKLASLLSIDIQQASALTDELYGLALDLGVPYLIAEVLNDSAMVFETAGEYDLAITSHLEVKRILGESDWTSQILSRIYASLGDGQRALDEIDPHIEFERNSDVLSWYLRRARAFALLNRIEDAERDLAKIHEQIMKTGLDYYYGIYSHISGLIEIARRDYAAALDILEKCLEIFDRISRVLDQNYVLLDLARVELLLARKSPDSTKSASPGRWLARLEQHAIDRDLPGIRMQAALLKSEFYQIHGQLKDAHATLVDALNITESLGVKTLRRRISDRTKEIERLMFDEEVVS